MRAGELLLPPRGPKSARILVCSEGIPEAQTAWPEKYVVPVERGSLLSFATLTTIISDLKRRESTSSGFATLSNAERDVLRLRNAEKSLRSESSLHGAVLKSKGTLAALRRVSQRAR